MILIAGPPGAGKSVQAQKLEKDYAVTWLSTGELLRASVDEEVKAVMVKGELLSDDLVQRVLIEAIDKVAMSNRVLLDGFPRRLSQVKWFIEFMRNHPRDLQAIVHIEVPVEVSLERLSKRGREDDLKETIVSRYNQYHDEILPMLEHLRHSSIDIIAVNGNQPVEAVYTDITASLEDYLSK